MSTTRSRTSRITRRRLQVLIIGAIVLIVAYLIIAMPGMDHSAVRDTGTSQKSVTHDGMVVPTVNAVGPTQFDRLMDDPQRVLLNVHVPYDGELPMTDRFIAYSDIIQSSAKLAGFKDRPVLVYCRSGRMSAIAAKALLNLGYSNVTELSGGMNAWEFSGRKIKRRSLKPAPPTPTDQPTGTTTYIG